MTLTVDMGVIVSLVGVLVSCGVVTAGFIIALARQVSALSADVATLSRTLQLEHQERQAADLLEAGKREQSLESVHRRIDDLHRQQREVQ